MKLSMSFAVAPCALVLPLVLEPEKEPLEERKDALDRRRWPPGGITSAGEPELKQVPCATGARGQDTGHCTNIWYPEAMLMCCCHHCSAVTQA